MGTACAVPISTLLQSDFLSPCVKAKVSTTGDEEPIYLHVHARLRSVNLRQQSCTLRMWLFVTSQRMEFAHISATYPDNFFELFEATYGNHPMLTGAMATAPIIPENAMGGAQD